MKSYVRLMIVVFAILIAIGVGVNLIMNKVSSSDLSRPYRVEANRIANRFSEGEELAEILKKKDYPSITGVEKIGELKNIEADSFGSHSETDQGITPLRNSDHMVMEVDGSLLLFDYTYQNTFEEARKIFNICYIFLSAVIVGILLFIGFQIIRPFEKISDYAFELAKGNLVAPLKEGRGKFYGKFLWGLNLLREKLKNQRAAELALQKQNKTMVLSLSHDIKTPLSIIELYSKALEKGLYQDEQKKKEVVLSIRDKCEDIRGYIDGIIKTTSEEFLDLEVHNTEFYLSDLMKSLKTFYTDKLGVLKIDFSIARFSDCLLAGDMDRAIEVVQNIIENAIKYGDGKKIWIDFSKEENCQLIHIGNSGCTLSDADLPHIFECFWRGANVGNQNGSGLGMYICRALMHKMEGDIYADVRDGNMIVTAVFMLA